MKHGRKSNFSKSLSVGIATFMLISLISVLQAGTAGAQDGSVNDYKSVVKAAADRLVALQSTTDYGWDWVVTGLTAHSGNPSATNLYGVTALGLPDAYQITNNPSYYDAAKAVADFITYGDPRAGDFYNGIPPGDNYYWGFSFDYRFLMRFAEVSENSYYENYAKAAWGWQKTNRCGYYGSENQEAMYNLFFGHYGTHGGAVWQSADFGLAAFVMGDTTWAGDMAGVVSSHLGDIADNDVYKVIGWGRALTFLATVDPTTYADNIAYLTSKLIDSQDADGHWDGGQSAPTQDTAYAIMGLVAAGEKDAARRGAGWLLETQLINGGWKESDDNEYSEIDSEAVQALVATGPAPVTVDGRGFFTIQQAIDNASPGDTVLVAAGTYDPFTVSEKENLTIKSASEVIVKGAKLVVTAYTNRGCVVFVKNSKNIVLDGLDIEGEGLIGLGDSGKNYGVIYENSSGTIKDSTVSPNTVGDMASVAIGVWDGSDVTIDLCVIENFGRIGVFVYNGCTVGVYDSTIVGQEYSGEGQVVYGIEVEGAWMDNSPETASHVTIVGNEIYNCNNTFSPEPLWGSSGILINGWMEHFSAADSTVIVENNDIYNNYDGIYAIKSSKSYARHNNISNNGEYGVVSAVAYDDTSATFDATLNWWDNSSGPSGIGSGEGDAVSTSVNYNPWLLEPKDEPQTYYDYTLALESGWNLISTPKILENENLSELIVGATVEFYTYDGNHWIDTTSMKPLDAVFVKMGGSGGMGFKWTTNEPVAPPTKQLEEGWNLVGSSVNIPHEAFVPVGEALDSVFGSWSTVFSPAYNLSAWTVTTRTADTENMLPYEGYWVYMRMNDELAGRTV